MLEILVLIIISIVLLNKINDLRKTKTDLENDIHNSLNTIRLQLNVIIKKIASQSADTNDISQQVPPDLPSKEKPKEPTLRGFESIEAFLQGVKKQASYSEPIPQKAAFEEEDAVTVSRKKSKLEESIGSILKRIWTWILVGEDKRPENVSIEYAVASTWLMRLGVIALVICIGYFLKWSIDQGILGPTGRIALSIIAGIAMLILGVKNFRKKYDILAQGFLGGGLATLYFSMYAAGPMYHKIPFAGTFVLMILITIVAGVMSYKFNSQLVAIFGIIGGFCTPIILSTPGVSPVGLYAYMLLLSMGILGIAHVRNWRLLNYLGFIFTWFLVFMSFSDYKVERDFSGTIIFLSLLFILHAMIVYYYNLVKRKQSSNLEIIHLLFNSLIYASTAYFLIFEAHGRPWPAVMAIGIAVFYITHIYIFLRNRINDRSLLVCLIGVAGFFTAWAIPLLAEKETIAICWSLQAFFFLWIGLKLNSNLLVNLAHILYLLVMGRLVLLEIPGNFPVYSWQNVPMNKYWAVFFERIWTFGIVITSFFSAFTLHKRKIKQLSELTVEGNNNTKLLVSQFASQEIMFWGGVAFMFIVIYFELFQMFTYYRPLQMPILTLLCCLLGGYMLYNYFAANRRIFLPVAIVVMITVIFKIFIFDYSCWASDINWCIYAGGYSGVLMRLLDYGVVFIYIIGLMRIVSNKQELISYRKTFTVISTALLFIYVSLETNTFFYWYVHQFQEGAVSVIWALFAVAYLVIGIVKSSENWRYSGLALFAIVVAKVFIVDLVDMEVLHRVIAFMLLGLILIGGAFAYINANKKFRIEGEK
ncbi:MAG: DUF2339 domain-containing protein [Candidatus Omnitrophota bacterium]